MYSSNLAIPPLKHQKLALIQLFRGLAALIVLTYHSSTLYALNLNYSILDNSFKFGKAGVDFFFVLSGFIIYTVHKNDIGIRTKIPYFVSKRLIRIYPLYWLILCSKLVFKSYTIWAIFSAFILFPYPNPPLINVSWTLSYEVFFYSCFGLLIYYRSTWLRYVLIWGSGIIFLFWTGNLFLNYTIELRPFYHFILSYHHLEFLMGIAASYLVSNLVANSMRYWLLSIGLVLFFSASIYTVYDINRLAYQYGISIVDRSEHLKTITEKYSYLFFGVPSFFIIWGSAHIDNIDKWHIPKSLLYIGNASYAIYLTHSSIINITTLLIKKTWNYSLSVTIIPTMLIALCIGCLVHEYIENPALKYMNKWIERFKTKNLALKII